MKTECVADISMNSVLAEYNRELYEQYGLLMVDTSYGTGNHSIVNTQEHLRSFVQKNFDRTLTGRLMGAQTMTAIYCKDAKITGSSFAADNGGKVLNRQILAYMAGEALSGSMTDVYEKKQQLQGAGFDTTDVEEMARENQEEIDSIELPTFINEDGEEEEVSLGNPADTVNSQKGIGVLTLAAGNRYEISTVAIDKSVYASSREKNHGTGLRDGEDISESEKLLIDQYFYEKCSRYGREFDKSLLKYQVEYLIFGENGDWKNLEKMAETLLFWREASNMTYLFGCRAKVAQAQAIASALTAVLLVPELEEPVKYSILFAWTFAESISDIAILLGGGRVPLFKSDHTWKLGITEMFFFRDHIGRRDCGEGLYYKDYLRMRLLMEPLEKKTERFMDIAEMDIRKTPGNAYFKMDHCLDVYCAEITVGTKYGYEAKIERVYGYEE